MSSWRPECVGAESVLETGPRLTPQPTFPDKGGPPTLSPSTQWDAWVKANYAEDTPSPAGAPEVGDSMSEVAESGWYGFEDTSQPSKEPVSEEDPFSWSGGTFNGESFTSYTDTGTGSPWWSQAAAASGASVLSTCLSLTCAVVLVLKLI